MRCSHKLAGSPIDTQISVYKMFASFVPFSTSDVTITSHPCSLAISWQVSTSFGSGMEDSGAQATNVMPIFAQPTISELATLFFASPMKTNFKPSKEPKFSRIVSKSAIVCVGWHSLVKPFHTGTPAYSAKVSTIS